MNKDLTCLCDPKDGSDLVYKNGDLHSTTGHRYSIINGIPRFVASENYSDDFGLSGIDFPKPS